MRTCILAAVLAALAVPAAAQDNSHDALVARHAAANGVPEALVRRVIMIETRGNARLVSKGNYGLMQIRLGTAQAMGYSGSAEGLLDADTNMTYAVKYLAGAYRAAGGNMDRAVHYYQRGYYAEAKAGGFTPYQTASVQPRPVVQAAPNVQLAPNAPLAPVVQPAPNARRGQSAVVVMQTNEPSKEVQVAVPVQRVRHGSRAAKPAVGVVDSKLSGALTFFADHSTQPVEKHPRRRKHPKT